MNIVNIQASKTTQAYTINFPIGVTTGSFTSQSTGDIRQISGTNIASYLVDGAPVVLPMSVTNNIIYNITIVPTNGALASSLTFTGRVGTISSTISSPDYSLGDGRYLYMMDTTANSVYKLDSALLVPSNYISAGAWTVTPIVATIVLPTLPSGTWGSLIFAEGNIYVLGGVISTSNVYYSCKILPNDSVYNLDETTLNGYTDITPIPINNSSGGYGIPRASYYDYVNKIIYYYTTIGASIVNGVEGYDIINYVQKTSPANDFMWGAGTKKLYFDPVTTTFITYGDFLPSTGIGKNLLTLNSLLPYAVYERASGRRWKPDNGSYARIYAYPASGGNNIASITGEASINNYSGLSINQLTRTAITFAGSALRYTVMNLQTSALKAFAIGTPGTGQTGISDFVASEYNNNHYALSNGGTIANKRLLVFDTTNFAAATQPNFGYLDFANNIAGIFTNKLL